MKRKLMSVLLTAAMVGGLSVYAVPVMAEDDQEPDNTVTGDSAADDAFVVWGWNDDIKNILDGPFKEAYPDDYKRIVFVNTGGSDYYQGKLDPVLDDPSNELYPDLMGLEVDYVQKYVNSDWVKSVADLGITEDDTCTSMILILVQMQTVMYVLCSGRQHQDASRYVQIWQKNILELQIRLSWQRNSKILIRLSQQQKKLRKHPVESANCSLVMMRSNVC